MKHGQSAFVGSIGVVLYGLLSLVCVIQSEVLSLAMCASDCEVSVLFSFLGEVANAKAADIVLTAVRYENVVEEAQANWALVFEFQLLCLIGGEEVAALNLLLVDLGFDANLASLPHLVLRALPAQLSSVVCHRSNLVSNSVLNFMLLPH